MIRASLVCKAWRDPALERRWRSILITSVSALQNLATVDRAKRTNEISISCPKAAGHIERLVTQLRGVDRLEVASCAGLAPFFLTHASLIR